MPERFGAYRTIYYVPGEGMLGPHHAALFQAAGIPILQVDVVREHFLRKYADRTPGTDLRQVESGVVELVEPEAIRPGRTSKGTMRTWESPLGRSGTVRPNWRRSRSGRRTTTASV